jgi:hypothetical protein
MKRNLSAIVALLMLALLLAPMAGLRAQTTGDADFEILETTAPASDTATATPAQAPWPVCRNGHWIRSAPGYPPVCTVQHIDALQGPLAPCSIITIGGVKYHILRVVKTTTGWIITIRRI